MRLYYPDVWKIIKIEKDGETVYKVLAEFKGGYLDGDSWRMSSGVLRVEENDRAFEVVNHSGSVYVCVKGKESFGSLTSGIFENYSKQLKSNKDVTFNKTTMNKLKKELDSKSK
jgi:hypothetical protein